MDDYDKALETLEKAISLTPEDPTINEHLGDVYMKKKMYTKALQAYEKALTLKHPDPDRVKKKIEEVKPFIENAK